MRSLRMRSACESTTHGYLKCGWIECVSHVIRTQSYSDVSVGFQSRIAQAGRTDDFFERPAKLCQAPKPRKRDVSSISASLDNRPCGWRGYDGDGDSGIINPLCSVAIGSIPSARPVVKAKPPAAVAASAGNPSGFGSGNLRIIRARETHYAAVTAATQRACMSFMCSSGVRIS